MISEAGSYTEVFARTGLCDSIVDLIVTDRRVVHDIRDTLCLGSGYLGPDGKTITEPGSYHIVVSATGQDCDTIYNLRLLGEDCAAIEFPNAFSPNGDQINDGYQAFLNLDKFPDLVVDKWSLRIYNRWGEELANFSDHRDSWDGRVKGKDAPVETYIYVVEYDYSYVNQGQVYFTKKNESQKGSFALLR